MNERIRQNVHSYLVSLLLLPMPATLVIYDLRYGVRKKIVSLNQDMSICSCELLNKTGICTRASASTDTNTRFAGLRRRRRQPLRPDIRTTRPRSL